MLKSDFKPGDVVVYESTVYPGAVEEECMPILAQTSGLRCGEDFTVGYSPERINPGDKQHRFESIIKVVAGQDDKTLRIIADVYGSVVKAGIHCAPSTAPKRPTRAPAPCSKIPKMAFIGFAPRPSPSGKI